LPERAVNIVVDQNIRAAEATFGAHARLRFMDGRAIRNEHLREAEALIVRTATRVDETLLRGTPVGFVGTTSIGTDHMDLGWLQRQGIAWANAPGCNADAAAQYTLAMAWLACERLGRSLAGSTAGVVGCGNVGSRVRALFEGLGMPVVANDPPLADAGRDGLELLDEALAQDIVCLHVPLTVGGLYPTRRFIGRAQLGRMPSGALLVNTARGDVVDQDALLAELRAGRLHAALDVWPGEPRIDAALLEATTVATPHVAGYSDDGKRKGTLMVYAAFCAWAGLAPVAPPAPPGAPPLLLIGAGEDALARALDAACFVRRHDAAMRLLAGLAVDQRAQEFDRLRRDYPPRRDFQAWQVRCADLESARLCHHLGFTATAAS
jgi:erythronate-4-phosphate dehydrogenase